MKILSLIFITIFFNISIGKCLPSFFKTEPRVDSIALKAKRLKQLYLLSTSSSAENSYTYQKQFFDEFPNTFNQLQDLYGYINDKPKILYEEAPYHILNLFNKLENINDTLYYKKIVDIAIGGNWDADAVNYFQEGLKNKVLANPKLTVYFLKQMSDDKISSFWHFYFDEPYPKKQISNSLLKIDSIDSHIYNLMIDAQKEVLIQHK